MPYITQKEACKLAKAKGYSYIACDLDNRWNGYLNKPKLGEEEWLSSGEWEYLGYNRNSWEDSLLKTGAKRVNAT